ncbi:MAG: transcriptional repressor LexA [Clostridia bacterium]|nr:transcriptional repressor LexA [Clostridia bacterium]
MKKVSDAPMVIYRFICAFSKENGYPPTVREICRQVGLSSPATVHAHLKKLMEQGLIEKDPHKQRAYVVTNPQHSRADAIPLLGKVAAGLPINAIENYEDAFFVPEILTAGLPPDETFMLRVEGYSMMDAGMLDGDIIVVGTALHIEDGDIVVARLNHEEVTVKRLYSTPHSIILKPENPAFEPIEVPKDQIEVIGKVLGLMRQL